MNWIFKNKVRYGVLLIGCIGIVAVLFSFYLMLRKETGENVKIGVILPLTGAKNFEAEVKDGMLLAEEEINARNGINGRSIELIVEDSKTDPQEGRNAFNRIEKAHHPLLYVSVLSVISMAVAPLSEEDEVVLFGLVTASEGFTDNKEWVFRYYPSADIDARPILSVLDRLKVKKLGILYVADEYGSSVTKIVNAGFQKNGRISRCESFEMDVLDYSKQIFKFKDMEAICFVGFVHHIQQAVKQLREMRYDGVVIVTAGGSNPVVTSMPEANGIYVSAPIIFDPNYIYAKRAKEKYEAEYDKQFNLFSATGYDFLIFIAGLLEGKELSRRNVKKILEKGFIYPGVLGTMDVKAGQHEIPFPFHPARVVDGELKYLHQYMNY